jgi:K+-transporting ATPase A subunit
MTANGWLQIALFFGAVLRVAKPMGVFLYRVYKRKSTWLDRVMRPIEKLIYRVCGVDETKEMRWTEYGAAMLLFSGASLLLVYLIERVQLWLPRNPQKLANVAPDPAWNTVVSFTTNTNWQAYTGNDDELSDADGRAGLSQLCVRSSGNRGSCRRNPRHGAERIQDHREFLGGHDARAVVGFVADMPGGRARAGVAGSGALSRTRTQR